MKIFLAIFLCLVFLALNINAGDLHNLPVNTWVRITSSPGDPAGREVPPGRAATWVWEPNTQKFLRYGGYTPTFTNSLYAFNAETNAWTILHSHNETFPADRPGGGCNWFMSYDTSRKVIWLAGGWRSGGYTPAPYAIGDQGIWKYEPVGDTFTKVGACLGWNTYYAHDPVNNVIVAAPIATALDSRFNGNTYVFDLAANLWVAKSTVTSPQEVYSGSHPMVFDPSIGKCVLLKGAETWTYDAGANEWAKLSTTGTPPTVRLPALAYDPDHQVVFRFGGSDGKYYNTEINETWVFNGSTSTWTQLTAPGIPMLVSANALLYNLALAWDPVHHCMLLNDPDLGVWAFKYDPLQAMGTSVVDAQALAVGTAAANPPAAGPAETFLSFPTALNSRLLNMGDNSLLKLNGTNMTSGEIMWAYDSDLGIIFKYGGCGNPSSPFWEGYGNNLDMYDPGTESCFTRRVGEVSGGARPINGCTRSVFYDSKRKVWWCLGAASSGPYNPWPAAAAGPFTYDPQTDIFTDLKKTGGANPGNPGCVLTYDPDHDIAMMPAAGATYIFNCATGLWESRSTSSGPGTLYAYNRTVYITTLKKYFCLNSSGQAWMYDPAADTWEDKTAGGMPPARGSKLGLVYDSANDVVLLIAGQVSWNTGPFNDLWAYHPSTNTWESLTPAAAGGSRPTDDCMMSAYDSRHNATIIANGGTILAYRYKRSGTGILKANAATENEVRLIASPNPFKPSVHITIKNALLKSSAHELKAKVCDINGRTLHVFGANEIQTLNARNCGLSWNASHEAAGIYILRVTLGKKTLTQRLLLEK